MINKRKVKPIKWLKIKAAVDRSTWSDLRERRKREEDCLDAQKLRTW